MSKTKSLCGQLQGIDANNYFGKEKSGIYTVAISENNTNFPVSTNGGTLLVFFGTDIRGVQMFIPRTSSVIYTRTYWDGSWLDWQS